MADRKDMFSERLLALEHTDPALRERYRQAVEAMLVRPLTGPQWLLHAVVAVFGLVAGGVCATLVVTEPAGLPPLTRAALTLFAVFGVSWSLWAAGVLQRGAVHRRRDRAAAARMAFGFAMAAVVMIAALAAASPGPTALVMVMVALAMAIAAAVVMLSHAIEQAELRGREQVLALELRLAELGDRLTGARDGMT